MKPILLSKSILLWVIKFDSKTFFFFEANFEIKLLMEMKIYCLKLCHNDNIIFVDIKFCIDFIVYEVVLEQKVGLEGKGDIILNIHW